MGLGQSKRLSNVHIFCVGVYGSLCPFYLNSLQRESPLLVYLEFVGRRYAWLKLGAICLRILARRHERHLWLGVVTLGNGNGGGGIESSAYIAPHLFA